MIFDKPCLRYVVYKHANSWFVETPFGSTYGPYFAYDTAAARCRRLTGEQWADELWHF